jgi:hypothetical protein
MVSTEELNQVDGTFYHHVNTININYDLSNHGTSAVMSFLMDGGINGGMTGSDVCVISSSDVHKAKVTRIGESTFNHLPLVTAAGFVDTHHGPAIIILLHQYAHYGKANTIHSAGHLPPLSTQVHKMPRRQGI